MHGNQVPTYSWCAGYDRTEGQYAIEMANFYGMPPHPWQCSILMDWLALDPYGKLLNSMCVVPVPRQNGKTGVCDPRESWGLISRGEWILHTAHEYQTAKLAFDRLRQKFGERKNDPKARFPELNALVKRYTTSANQMVLDLTNGAHIEFRTRGSNSDMGRGGTFDLVVVDEAQSYTDEQDAALSPLNSAAPKGSPQTIFMGTVPDVTKSYKGEKFAKIRASVHEAPYTGACIHEWSAPEVGDPTDASRWYQYNPSLGYQLLESALLKDSRSMTAETFAREHLGWWPESIASTNLILKPQWDACRVENPSKEGLVAYGIQFSQDGSVGTLAACHRPKEGRPFVYVVDSRSLGHGLGWFVETATRLASRAAVIVVDGQSNAQTLIDRLNEAHVPKNVLVRARTQDVATACSTLVNAVKEKSVCHYGQPALDTSATRSRRLPLGKGGGCSFASTEEADATLIQSVALAYWGAMTTKRNPERKARAW